jgi:hypothetical protein
VRFRKAYPFRETSRLIPSKAHRFLKHLRLKAVTNRLKQHFSLRGKPCRISKLQHYCTKPVVAWVAAGVQAHLKSMLDFDDDDSDDEAPEEDEDDDKAFLVELQKLAEQAGELAST